MLLSAQITLVKQSVIVIRFLSRLFPALANTKPVTTSLTFLLIEILSILDEGAS